MPSLFKSEPIQLVYKENGDLKINQSAIDVLKKIDKYIAVCVCVGPYRQGKSFLLNKLLADSYQFRVGHEDEACTEGVWVYEHPIKIKDNKGNSFTILMMDIEGMESERNSFGEMDTKLFLLALLMSSMLIYNSKSALSSESLKKLAVAATIGDKIKTDNGKNIHITTKPNTDFVWVVRDFALIENDTPTNKLHKLLNPEEFIANKRFNTETNEKIRNEIIFKNKIKDAINNTFDQKECFYVPVPVSDGTNRLTYEEALQRLDELPYECLRSEFRKQIDKIKSYIMENIQIKQVNDSCMNGPLFCEYLKQIVSSINKENVIFLNETINTCLKTISKEAVFEAIKFYSAEMNRLMEKDRFYKTKEFERQKNNIFEDSVNFLNEKIKIYSESVQFECEDDLAESSVRGEIFAINNRFSLINEKRISKKNVDIGIEFYNEVILMKINIASLSQFKKWFKEELKIRLFECKDFNQFWIELITKVDFERLEKKFEDQLVEKYLREKELVSKQIRQMEAEREALKKELEESEQNRKAQSRLRILKTDPTNSMHQQRDIYLRKDGNPDLRHKENRVHLVAPDGTILKKDGTPDMRVKENKQKFGVKQKF